MRKVTEVTEVVEICVWVTILSRVGGMCYIINMMILKYVLVKENNWKI